MNNYLQNFIDMAGRLKIAYFTIEIKCRLCCGKRPVNDCETLSSSVSQSVTLHKHFNSYYESRKYYVHKLLKVQKAILNYQELLEFIQRLLKPIRIYSKTIMNYHILLQSNLDKWNPR